MKRFLFAALAAAMVAAALLAGALVMVASFPWSGLTS